MRGIAGWFVLGATLVSSAHAFAAGDAAAGKTAFENQCASCHSTEPGVNMTGPSLAGIFGRKAGSFPSFHRYSDALKLSGIVWDDQTLDAWLRNPAALVPGNEMPFPGIPDANARIHGLPHPG